MMQMPGQGGAQGQPGLTQQPPMQFGPESLMALIMAMSQGQGQNPLGQQAGSGMAVGQSSMAGLLPMLMQALQPQQQPGAPGTQAPGQPPQQQPKSPVPGGQQPQQPQGPMQGLMQILQMLGMGGQPKGASMQGRSGPPAL